MWRYSTRVPKLFQRYYCSAITIKNLKSSTETTTVPVVEESNEKSHQIIYNELKYETKVPLNPISATLSNDSIEEIDEIDSKTIQLLERLSLVDLDSKEAYKTLKDSIQFANKIINIDTKGIEPLYTVLEYQPLYLRNDEITEGNCRDDILKNAKIIEDDYFVAPPGNIPLEQEEKKFE